jgi:hypothetical protein
MGGREGGMMGGREGETIDRPARPSVFHPERVPLSACSCTAAAAPAAASSSTGRCGSASREHTALASRSSLAWLRIVIRTPRFPPFPPSHGTANSHSR